MKIKKNYILKKDSKAFTLVELLATIAILGLVISITVFTGIRLIKNGKEKTYQTTKNNIEKYASNYLIENGDRLFYLSKNDKSDIEYQCVTLKNLIDTGYFDTKLLESKVAEGISPKESDYVYIERDIHSKSIKKNVYIKSTDNEYKETCDGAVKAEMDIAFLGDFNSWGKTKDITIIYKLKNANNVNDYEYGYGYSNDKIELLKDNGNEKVVRVSDNGTLTGMINYLKEKAYEDSIIIDMIDNDGPIITLGDYKKGFVRAETSVNLNVYDEKIGVDGSSFSEEDIEVTVGGNKVTDLKLTDTGNGNYKLTIKNKQYDGKVVISIDKDKVLDKLGNGNEAVKFEPDITFDNTPPSKPVIDNPSKENWINSSFGLTLHTKEEGSGVDHWQYTYNENASSTGSDHNDYWKIYDNSDTLDFGTADFSQERNQLVYVRACDKVGNCSEKDSTYIRIDKKEPEGEISLSENNKTITATASVSDALSGLNGTYEWKVDTNSTCDSTVSGFTSSSSSTHEVTVSGTGIYYACLKASDNAGNVAYFSQQVNVAEDLSCWYLNGYNTYCRYEPNIKKGGDNIYSQKIWNSKTNTYYYSQKLWESGTYFNIDGWTYGTDDKGNGNSTIWYHSKTYNCYLISTYLKEREPRGSCPGWNGNAADGWANCTCNTDADCGSKGNVITSLKCDTSMKSGKTEKDGKYMCVWRVGTSNQYNTCW